MKRLKNLLFRKKQPVEVEKQEFKKQKKEVKKDVPTLNFDKSEIHLTGRAIPEDAREVWPIAIRQIEEYVEDFKTIEKQKRIKFLEDEIFSLNFKKQNGSISDLEKALLDRYRDELTLLRL